MALFVFIIMLDPIYRKLAFWKHLNWEAKKSLSMAGNVNSVEKDSTGNIWYLNSMYRGLSDLLKNGKPNIDMGSLPGKRLALKACIPFASVVDRCGSMFANGRFYVTDKSDNEHLGRGDNKYNRVRNLLNRPNPIQSGKQFNKQVEICLKTFGFCPIYILRGLRSDIPSSMWIIPPELFHIEIDRYVWTKSKTEDLVKKAWIEWNGQEINLETYEYFIVSDAIADTTHTDGRLYYNHVTDSLSPAINNWISQMMARGTLIVDGGPKGILCDDSGGDVYGNSSLNSKEAENLNKKFKEKYGIVGKLFSILVTTAKVKWVPITGNADDLKLYEEETECRNAICNAIGINPNVFVSDSTYENQKGAKRDAYQDLIMPDAENYCEALTAAIVGGEDIVIRLDYSHVSALQEDKKSAASALSLAATAIRNLYNDKILTLSESRKEMANYVDIDPDNPEGEFKESSYEPNNMHTNEESEK